MAVLPRLAAARVDGAAAALPATRGVPVVWDSWCLLASYHCRGKGEERERYPREGRQQVISCQQPQQQQAAQQCLPGWHPRPAAAASDGADGRWASSLASNAGKHNTHVHTHTQNTRRHKLCYSLTKPRPRTSLALVAEKRERLKRMRRSFLAPPSVVNVRNTPWGQAGRQ